ncbi:MAG: saccharopine dehydrogenase family protein [Campylobacteraceae bacterium]|jgi:saccharopine dehydrogenase (NAD+, L-lysine-forming)|nr:saccharopine dehydrogenase family protein [Campylobacteraceae bacterium]
MNGTILIIGAGGVSRVATTKCALNSDIFKKIVLASRTKSKCDEIAKDIKTRQHVEIETAKVDADNVDELIALINRVKPSVVLNLALPYQDLSIMDACLKTKVNYVDTANYEHPDVAKFEYKLQWEKNEDFKKAGILGLLGSGFDPGVTNVFCAYAEQNLFDEINEIDILDCNAGDHGYPFATNFNPEINLREVSANGRYWEDGKWIETKPMAIKMVWDYPEVGPKDSYLLYHEELESLVKNIKGLKRIRFFMTFGQSYLTHMKCLENVGMLGINEVTHNGMKIVPIQFLKTLLPDPASLGARTKGKTNIGCVISGVKNGKKRKIYIYNVCDHEECYKETLAQAVSYTTGVPAMIGAKLVMEGKWKGDGVYNMENFDAKPFMDELNKQGLPWKIIEMNPDESF